MQTGHHVPVVAETDPTTGCREFRLDPHDTERVDVFLEDYTGRRKPMFVHRSAVLLMVPTGEIGALVFEPAMTPTGAARDVETGRPIWIQRIILGQHEVWDMIDRQLQMQKSPIVFPGRSNGNGRRL